MYTSQITTMYTSMTGKKPEGLYRMPQEYAARTVRAFVAHRLPKISTWLFDKPPEQDIELLRKLSKSKYDTADGSSWAKDPEKVKSYRDNAKAKSIREYTANAVAKRNSDTDWGTMKGTARKIRRA